MWELTCLAATLSCVPSGIIICRSPDEPKALEAGLFAGCFFAALAIVLSLFQNGWWSIGFATMLGMIACLAWYQRYHGDRHAQDRRYDRFAENDATEAGDSTAAWPNPLIDERWTEGERGAWATFEYVDADGVVTNRKLSSWSSDGPYIHGFCMVRRDVRTFRKDRIADWSIA